MGFILMSNLLRIVLEEHKQEDQKICTQARKNLRRNIEILEDWVPVGTATVDVNAQNGGFFEYTSVCVDNGSIVSFVFNAGSYAEEISGEIYRDDSSLVGTIYGSGDAQGPQELIFNGASYPDSYVFFSETAQGQSPGGGSDANDNDASIH